MAVVPRETNGVFANRLNFRRPRRRLEHGQLPGDGLERIAGLAAILGAFFLAQRARAGITQEREAVTAAMPILPLDVHAGAGGDVDFTRFRNCDWVHDDVGLAACESTHAERSNRLPADLAAPHPR